MKYAVIILLVTQSISLVHIKHLEASKKNQDFTLFYNQEKAPVSEPVLNMRATEPAELLPDIQSFDDALDGSPRAELFPEVAEAKPKKKR